MPEAGYKTINGSKIYYEIEGSGETIIFLHADTLDGRQWDDQISYFSKNYKTIRFDLRGFGKSDIPSTLSYSFSEDLYLLMEALQVEKAHLVGLSLGAAEIINFTLRYPEKCLSLTLADPGIEGDGFDKEFVNSVNKVVNLAKNGDLAKARVTWSALSFFDYSRNNPDVWNRIMEMVSDTSCYRWYGTNQPITSEIPAVNRLEEIQTPTLIIVGDHDIPNFQRKSKLLHEKIAASQFVIVPNAGHVSNMDNPEAFNKVVELFLKNQY